MNDRFLTTAEVAAYCGVHGTTAMRWVDAGVLPARRTPGNHRRVRPADLRAFMEERGFEVPKELATPGLPIRVLVVDDDEALVRTFVRRLKRKPRLFDPRGTTSAVDALIAIGREPPHVVIVDLVMPGLDGLELGEKIRHDPELADVQVIAMTGHPSPDLEARCQEVGMHAFLAKPVSVAALEEGILSGRLAG